jgi:predicted nuclease of predicted toxin-antitoxin system
LKILIAAQLPPGLKVMLAAAGHDANHVIDVGLRDADDAQVLGICCSGGNRRPDKG